MLLIFLSLLQINFAFIPIDLSFTIVSDTTNWVVCPTDSTAKYAVVTNDSWGDAWTTNFPGASRIWEVSGNPPQYYNCTFYKYFHIAGSITSALLIIAIDDAVYVTINGSNCDCQVDSYNYNNEGKLCDITKCIMKGLNLLSFNCHNFDGPAALMYQLNISSSVG